MLYVFHNTLFTSFRNNIQMHIHFRKVNFLSCVCCVIRVTHSIFNEHFKPIRAMVVGKLQRSLWLPSHSACTPTQEMDPECPGYKADKPGFNHLSKHICFSLVASLNVHFFSNYMHNACSLLKYKNYITTYKKDQINFANGFKHLSDLNI